MDHLWSQIKLVEKELVLMQHCYAVGLGGGVGEVLQVLRDQQLGTAPHRRCQDVAILQFIRHRVDKLLITCDLGIGEVTIHLSDAV